ncbi:MAG: crossover junction endodeoxyribonuclease RuvC [Gammaproteobacteria bacterium]|nr:crossover junction endodeoxyribonuclease RuvC [Gammaproteobacteria bacterium]
MKTKIRIIGIDPGSRITGYGVLDTDGFRHSYVASGHIATRGDDELPQRLGTIFQEVAAVIALWQPESMAIEQVFMSRNADSALKLGQARGAAICAGVQAKLSVDEYAARVIKKSVVGTGAADKQQIQMMMQKLLGLEQKLQSDEADALAIAMCHANHAHVRSVGIVRGSRRGRWV